jgi:hypothetical protein
MNLFEFDRETYHVKVREEVHLLKPFKDLITRDKTKNKEVSLKELALVWFVADISSDFQDILDEDERIATVAKDVMLPSTWKSDKKIKDAIAFYKQRSDTISTILYNGALTALHAVNDVFKDSQKLIEASSNKITAAKQIIEATKQVRSVISELRAAEKQIYSEKEDTSRTVGSQEMNIFEDGLFGD